MTESYVTIATDDISCLGCLVLCNSLKKTGTEKLISVLVNPLVSCHLKNILRKSFDKVFCAKDLYVISDGRNRFDVHGDYEKLKCWLLTDFTKCVFLESDVLVVENIDDLFDRMEFSAVSDPRWPDCFDAGVFVFSPCLKTYKQLITYSISNQIPDNSFQCLLNMFFCDWSIISMEKKIPFIYNCQMNNTFYTHNASMANFGQSIKAARLGNSVFHLLEPDSKIGRINPDNWNRLWTQWWKIFNEMVKPAVNNDDTLNFKRTGIDYGETSECFDKIPIQSCEFSCSIQNSECPSQVHNNACQPGSQCCEPFKESSYKDNSETSSSVKDRDNGDKILSSVVDNVDKDHRSRWERGEIDYMGEDSFINILAKLNFALTVPKEDDTVVNCEE